MTLKDERPLGRKVSNKLGKSVEIATERKKRMSQSGNDAQFLLYLALKVKFNGEGNGNPLQYSCLENPMNGRAW